MATIIKTLGNTTFQYTLTGIQVHKEKINTASAPYSRDEDVERALRRQAQPKRVNCFIRNLI
jgi:hypothetical protein